MSRKNPPAKWVLPETVNPSTRKCITVQVPDDPQHVAAFRGAMLALSSAYNWSDDLAHTAKDVAAVWQEIVDAMDWGCGDMPALQFRQQDCVLQVSHDEGTTWEDIYDAYTCARGASQDEINQEIHDGVISGGGQGPAGGSGTPGACYDYHVKLRGNDRWKVPVTISDGDTLTVTNARGGWTDNLPNVGFWYCPDGQQFILGQCNGGTSTSGTDPAPSINHMRLIAQIGSSYVDMYNLTHNVPAATGDVDVFFQANDVAINDNGGDIEFDLQVCKGAWCYTFDFTASDGGWIARSDFPYATYVSGLGWQIQVYSGSTYALGIEKSFTSTVLTEITVQWHFVNADGADAYAIVSTPGSESDSHTQPSGTVDVLQDWVANIVSTKILVATSDNSANGTPGTYISSITIRGAGINPFGTSNC